MIFIANWKLNKTQTQAKEFLTQISKHSHKDKVVVCPQSTQWALKEEFALLTFGAQNIAHKKWGALTGEVSAEEASGFGLEYALIGHSERRTLFGETHEMVALKVKLAVECGLKPVVCIGESLEEKKRGDTNKVLSEQIEKALSGLKANCVLVAYEPYWAIGTGQTPTLKEISQALETINQSLKKMRSLIQRTQVLYGGSVSEQNAKELSKTLDLDGFLIGGASLKVDSLLKIVSESLKEF